MRVLLAGLLLASPALARAQGAYDEAKTLSNNPAADGRAFDGRGPTSTKVDASMAAVTAPTAVEPQLPPEVESAAKTRGGIWGGVIGGVVGGLIGLFIAGTLGWTIPGFIVGALFMAVAIYAGVDVGQALALDGEREARGLPRKGD